MSSKNKKAEIIKNEQQIQGVVPALLAVDLALNTDALKAAEQLKTKSKASKKKEASEENEQTLAADADEAQDIVVADLVDFVVADDITLTQNKNECKINNKGEEECDEGGAWWKALLGVGLLGAAAGGGGGGGSSPPVVPTSNTFRHADFTQRDDQDDTLTISTTTFNQVNVVLDGSEHDVEGTDPLTEVNSCDRQLAVDFEGSRGIEIFTSTITDGDVVGLRIDYSGLDLDSQNAALSRVAMTVNQGSLLELEGGHYLEENDLDFVLEVSQDSALFNSGAAFDGSSVDVGDYYTDGSFDVLNFGLNHGDVIGEDLDLSAAGDFYVSGNFIYDSTDLLPINKVGYIDTADGHIVINGDCVGELDGSGDIVLYEIGGYGDSDLVNIIGSNADVSVSASSSSDIEAYGGNVVDIDGINATVDIDVLTNSNMYATADLVTIDGSSADVTLNISDSFVKSRNGDIVDITGDNAYVDIDLAGAEIDTDENLVRIVGNSADVYVDVSGNSLIDNDDGDMISIDGINALVDIDLATGSRINVDENLVQIAGNSADVYLDVSGNSAIDNNYGHMISIDGINALVDIDVSGSSDINAVDTLVSIDGINADVALNVTGAGTYIHAENNDLIRIDGAYASVDIDVTSGAYVEGDDHIVRIYNGDSTDVSINVSGDNSRLIAYEEELVHIGGISASVDVVVRNNASVDADNELIEIDGSGAYVDLAVTSGGNVDVNDSVIDVSGNSADVSVLVTGANSYVSSENEGLISIDGINASVDVDVTDNGVVEVETVGIDIDGVNAYVDLAVTSAGKFYADESVIEILGNSADVSVLVTGANSYVSSENAGMISIDGIDASVDVDVLAGGEVSLDEHLVLIDGDDAYVTIEVSGTNSIVSNDATDVVYINGDNTFVDLEVTANGEIYGEDSIIDIDGINADVSVLVTGTDSYVSSEYENLVNIYGDNASVDVEVLAGGEIQVEQQLIDITYNATNNEDNDNAHSSEVIILASGDGSLISNDNYDFIRIEGDQAAVSVTAKSGADIDASDALVNIDANHLLNQSTDFTTVTVLATGAGSTINNLDENEDNDSLDSDFEGDYAMVRANSHNTTVNFNVLSGAGVFADDDLIRIQGDLDGTRQVVDNATVDIVVSDDSTLNANGSLVDIRRGSNADVSLLIDDSSVDAFTFGNRDHLISIDGDNAAVDVDVINGSYLNAGDDVVNTKGKVPEVTITVDDSSVDAYDDLVDINGNSADVAIDINNGSDVDLGGSIVELDDGHDSSITLTMTEDSVLSYDEVGINVFLGNRANIDVNIRDSSIYGEDTLVYVNGTFADITLEMTDGSYISLDSDGFNKNNLIEVDGDDATVNFSMINDDRSYEEAGDDLSIDISGGYENDVINIGGNRADVKIVLTTDKDSHEGDDSLNISADGDFVQIHGDDASVDIYMVSAEISLDGDFVNIDGDNAFVKIVTRDAVNEPDEDSGIDGNSGVVINGDNATIILDLENFDNSDFASHFVQVDGDNSVLDVTINSQTIFVQSDISADGDLINLRGLNSSLDLVIDYEIVPESDNNSDTDENYIQVESIVDSYGRNANLNVEISDVSIDVDDEFIKATNADNLDLSVEIDRLDLEMIGGSDVFLINGNSADVDINIQSSYISADVVNFGNGLDFQSNFGRLVDATGNDLNLKFTAEELTVDNYDGSYDGEEFNDYLGGIFVSGKSAELDIDLKDSYLDLGNQNDLIRVVGDNLILDLLADELVVNSARVGIYADADNASLSVDISGSNLDLNNELVRVVGTNLTLDFDLADSTVSADSGIVVSGLAGTGHQINVELNNVSLGLGNSGDGEFLSVTNGQNLDLSLNASDLTVSADSFVSVQNAASADIQIDLVDFTAGFFSDNMVTLTGVNSDTTVDVNITNFGDGSLQNLIDNLYIKGDYFNDINNIDPLLIDGDILNISGQASNFNLSVTGLTATPFPLGPIPIVISGVIGHGDMVDLSGSNHIGTIQLTDSVVTVNDWSTIFDYPLNSSIPDGITSGFGLTSTTGILELIGNSNDIDIDVDRSTFMAISADYTNNSLIYSDGESNDIHVDMTSSVMGTLIGEFIDLETNGQLPSFFHGQERINLAYLEGDNTNFTFNSNNSEFNTRVEIQGSDTTYTHIDDSDGGFYGSADFNSVHLYVNGDDNNLTIDVSGSFSPLGGIEVGNEGIAYGGVIVGNNSSLDFDIDSQHLTLSTNSYSEDFNIDISESIDLNNNIDLSDAGLLISSDSGSTTTVDFNLVGGSHLDGRLDLTGHYIAGDSIDADSIDVDYDINIKVDATSTVNLDISAFGEDVVVNLELDNLNGTEEVTFDDNSIKVLNLINLDTSDQATTKITMQDNGDTNFFINHSGFDGSVQLVAEVNPGNINGPHNNDNYDRIVISKNLNMNYTGFNGENDDLDTGTDRYTAFQWNNNVSAEYFGNYPSDLTYGVDVNTGDGLLDLFGFDSGDGNWTANNNLADELIIYASSGDLTALTTALGSADAEGLGDWFDDIRVVYADGSGDTADIEVYTWDGDSLELDVEITDSYYDFFDNYGTVYDSNYDTITTYDYTAFHWSSDTNYGSGDYYSSDLTSKNEISESADDLIIFVSDSIDFTSLEDAMSTDTDLAGFDDVHVIYANGSGDSGDIEVYTWDEDEDVFILNAILEDSYNEFFDDSGNVYDSNIAKGAYNHAFNYFDINFTYDNVL